MIQESKSLLVVVFFCLLFLFNSMFFACNFSFFFHFPCFDKLVFSLLRLVFLLFISSFIFFDTTSVKILFFILIILMTLVQADFLLCRFKLSITLFSFSCNYHFLIRRFVVFQNFLLKPYLKLTCAQHTLNVVLSFIRVDLLCYTFTDSELKM